MGNFIKLLGSLIGPPINLPVPPEPAASNPETKASQTQPNGILLEDLPAELYQRIRSVLKGRGTSSAAQPEKKNQAKAPNHPIPKKFSLRSQIADTIDHPAWRKLFVGNDAEVNSGRMANLTPNDRTTD